MSPDSSPPMGKISPVQDSRETSFTRQQPFYPNAFPIQEPPTAYVSHAKRMSEAQRTDTTRVQSSISSGESGSSAFSYQKQHPSQQAYWQSPNPEHSYIDADPEKSRSHWERIENPSPRQSIQRPEMVEAHPSIIRYIQEQQRIEAEDEDDEDDHAPWVLFWLSILDPFHSMANCLYTLVITLILILLSPIRLFRNQVSFGDRIVRLLAPFHRHHLQMLRAQSAEHAHSFEFKPMVLTMVLLGSPFISIGVAIAAWISAAFWVFAFIMGNPDGTERRDDGRDAVLSVRNWWERYFLSALKDHDSSTSAV